MHTDNRWPLPRPSRDALQYPFAILGLIQQHCTGHNNSLRCWQLEFCGDGGRQGRKLLSRMLQNFHSRRIALLGSSKNDRCNIGDHLPRHNSSVNSLHNASRAGNLQVRRDEFR